MQKTDERRRPKIAEAILALRCFVAELDGIVLGYGVSTRDFFDHGFIALVHVDQSHRLQGIGAALVSAIEAHAPTEKLFASTNHSNDAMRSLLSKLGHDQVGAVDGLDRDDTELFYMSAC